MTDEKRDEKVTVSPAGNRQMVRPYSRKQFYDEQFSENNHEQLAVHVVAVFIVTSSGELLLQKRSADKRHNARLIDKTLGGHVTYGDNPDYTVMVETVQELLTPSIVLKNEDDFAKTHSLLKHYLNTVALIKHSESKELKLSKVVGGNTYDVWNVVHMYFGIYDGSTKPADKESAGMLYYKIEDLDKELLATPEQFTDDLKKLFGEYKNDLLKLVSSYGS
jgi:isopentenyldiphosphate isomerase